MGEEGDPERRPHGQVLVRPHRRRICARHLGRPRRVAGKGEKAPPYATVTEASVAVRHGCRHNGGVYRLGAPPCRTISATSAC
ncbi:hypothetical protein MTBUT4_320015 [Magnetospirillum sp. UT-4]|nr:hypothetical protein MTBUT4_320015 [Magnetospirillum sp. UT-4]